MNPTAIYSKTGKGVQEASGKTSQLSRGDRAILSAIDGKVTLKDLSAKFDRAADDKFFSLIRKMDQDGFIREVSPGTVQRGAANAPRPAAAKPSQPSQSSQGGGEELDFTQIFSVPPKVEKPPAAAPRGDPMAAARHDAEMRQRAEREAKAKADVAAKASVDSTQKFRIDAEARAKAAREATMAAAAEGKTRAEIEARTRAEAEAKAKAAADAKAKAEAQVRETRERAEREAREAKERAEREARAKVEAAEKVRRDAAESVQREAAELRRKVEEERRAREDAEILARVEAERTRRETEERARREAEEKKARQEADELRKKLDEERQAREEAERRAQEEREKREKVRAEEDRRAQEEEERRDAERRARDDQERKAREEQDRHEQEENQRQIRLAREAEDKKRRDADARKKKEEEARRWEQEEARRKSDDAYRQRAEQEDKVRAEREAVESVERAEAEKRAAEAADALSGSLLADLDSFSARQDEEGKEKEEAERKARVEAERRAQEEQVQREREEVERKARKEAERKARDEEERRLKEEEERQAREADEKQKADEAEKKKREREETARRQAARGPDADIPISRADMGMDDVGDDTRKLSVEARKALRDREREVARARSRGDQSSGKAAAAYKRKQPIKWGKPVAVMLFFLMVGAVVTLNFTPLSTTEYERLASDAVGAPVKIGAARMWVLAGVQMRFENVSIGESVKIAAVRAVPEIDALLGDDKVFSRLEMDGVVLQQEALGEVLLGGMKGRRLRAARIIAKDVKLQGPLALPVADVDATIGRDGKLTSVKLSGERVNGLLTPRGTDLNFELTMGDFTLPFLEKFSLADFGAKGTADRAGMVVSEFNGRAYDGTLVGNARIQWGAQWSVQGEIEGRDMNAAVFSPQMVSAGRIGGKGRYTMSGPQADKLHETVRLDGNFTVHKGALGSFDLARALQSTSAQSSGRTQFTELKGKLALAGATLALRDMELSAGLLRATGTLDIEPSGGLSGRINAELRTLRGTMYIGGKLADPQLRR